MRGHLRADDAYQDGLVRFIENHDEPRAAADARPGAAGARRAVATLTQTGARLVHDGQLEGRTVRLPVFLGRVPDEPADADARRVLPRGCWRRSATRTFRNGRGGSSRALGLAGQRHLARTSSPGAGTASRRWLVVVNLGDATAAGHVSVAVGRPPRARRGGSTTRHRRRRYERSGDDLCDGLYVELGAVALAPVHLTSTHPPED